MNKYSSKSRRNLDTCDPRLVEVFEAVLVVFDHSINEGARTMERQRELFAAKRTKTLNSNHIPKEPGGLSRAVDVLPYPNSWNFETELLEAYKEGDLDTAKRILHGIQRWALFAGHVLMAASMLGIKLRWGGDWDGDKDLADQNFDDWPHFELID